MRAVLSQADLDDALEGFSKKDVKAWTDEEKRKDRKALSHIHLHLSNNILQEVLAEKTAAALWPKLESIRMSKDLTGKMHMKMKLFTHNRKKESTQPMAVDRPARVRKPVRRLIEECNVSFALSCAEEIDCGAEPSTYTEAMISGDREKWMFAMQEEMQSLEKNGTWDIVRLPAGKKAVRCKWIFKRKEGSSPSETTRYKARLVAKGFSQIPGIDYNDVFSPVVKHSSIRALFGIVAMHNLELEQLDVKTAFLHGDLEEEIYMDQPEGFIVPDPNMIAVSTLNLLMGHLCMLLYVDDMLIAAKSKVDIANLKAQLSSEFEMKDLGAAKKILGMEISRDNAVGSLMYAMVCSRPDLSYAMSLVSRYMANPGKEHWNAVKWILRYLQGTSDAYLQFGRNREGLVGYVDSDHAADLDKRRSLTSYVFTIGGCAVSWRACLQSTVALFTTEAEFIAVCDACKEAVWLKGLYAEFSRDTSCINLFCDSQSAIHLTKDQMFHQRTKHIDVKYHYVREVVEEGRLKVCKISTHDNPADMMTKPVPVAKFELCSSLVGIIV
ncbi:hypothetical protein U9M48_035991 [Paspalum notatum var. saurae]|uniref:Reverse transcriptase Ty1/copia-type domain-containing protein n=1 Tax=Paspalum notatum var. saurae TaxID=547442 RepID=A0AAQ3UGK1_PASNO